jgi:hypothetical protein
VFKKTPKYRPGSVNNPLVETAYPLNIFNRHPHMVAHQTWWSHCKFTTKIAIRLFFTCFMFIIHGILPFLSIPKWLNLEDSALFLLEENKELEERKCQNIEKGDR